MSFFFMIDARIKLFFILLLTLAVFFVDKFPAAVFLAVSFTVIRLISAVPFRSVSFFKNLTLLAAIIIFIQMLFAPGVSYIIKPLFPEYIPIIGGTLSLKWEGLFFGIVIALRLAALMILLPVFTETTPPVKIAAGLCSLGVNYRIAFIITTAFNLVFFFREEAGVIMNAQKLRGLRRFGIKAAAGLLIPLMLCAMKKAQRSSVAMDCRGFGVYKTRTWTDSPKIKGTDILFFVFSVIFFTGILFLNYC